jgi:hypothetical protein
MIGIQPKRRKEMMVVEVRKQKGGGWKKGCMTLKNGRKLEVIVKSCRIEMATCSVVLDADMQRTK